MEYLLRIFPSLGIKYKYPVFYHVSKGEDFNVNTYYSEYKITKHLGQGGYGKVVLGVHKKTKEKVAIKITQVNMIITHMYNLINIRTPLQIQIKLIRFL